jgi:hypothetical protein
MYRVEFPYPKLRRYPLIAARRIKALRQDNGMVGEHGPRSEPGNLEEASRAETLEGLVCVDPEPP